ncbi:MAG: insulinase family protein [Bacillota bacterium]|jgi:Zn-dependent M16 (insulinase) family peptidase|nr:insulinase family protein [Bacillota bacterium]HOB92159.1 insulinase family protein [Bacillota bacterium]HPZ53963.1 insulinase family protein [Bacillota bacterium]HQD17433.1 insulinase family protein [Bacillota bacterium]
MEFQVGCVYHGFRLIDEKHIKELNSVARLFEHERSGARLYALQNDDDNKVFSISFRTPPTDSTGLPHILEHSVLCGSRKFPTKEPFVELAKGSLNTFLNAMTYPDKTMYPVSSRNEKDFHNLMDVYLDAVFYPRIYEKPEILMQEGWHYELNKPEDPITYRGVVYNEMKGAFSSPEQVLMRKIQESLFPDTPYGVESGGDPEVIPTLTQEQFVAFHRKYYHPSNCYIYLYGDMDLDDRLKFIDHEYLRHYERAEIASEIPLQKPFAQPREVVVEYPIAANEKESDKTFLSLNFCVGSSLEPELCLALSIMEHFLLETPAAPLKKALLDAGIGKDVFGRFEDSILQPVFSVVVKNSEESKREQFQDVVLSTLRKLVDEGIDKELIEASINRREFGLREADFGRFPKGLLYGILLMNSWLYDGDPALHLEYEPLLERVKTALTTDYFERLIDRYLLNNSHRSLVVVKPKRGLAEEREARVRQKLAEIKSRMSEDEINKIIVDTERLRRMQQEPDSPEALATIPLLSLDDIEKKAEELPLVQREEGGVTVLTHPVPTNKIAYVDLYFDSTAVPERLLPYIPLLAGVLGKVSTEHYSYEDLAKEINIHLGAFTASSQAFSEAHSDDEYFPKMVVRAKALIDKVDKLFALVKELLLHTRFDEEKRLREVIQEIKSRLEFGIINRGSAVAARRVTSYFSQWGKYLELTTGLTFYRFIADLERDFASVKEDIKENLRAVAGMVFDRSNLLVSVTSSEEDYGRVRPHLIEFIGDLPHSELERQKYSFDLQPLNEGLLTPGDVQFVAKGYNFRRLGYSFSGAMHVLATIAGYDYLWNRVRVQGGAYGCSASFSRIGNLVMTSYRDPNLVETLEVFDGTGDYLRNFNADEREMRKYIIGTISQLDTPLTPSMKGERAAIRFISGLSQEAVQRERDEVLAANLDSIRSMADMLDEVMKQQYLCVLGNESKIRQNEKIFGSLVDVFD